MLESRIILQLKYCMHKRTNLFFTEVVISPVSLVLSLQIVKSSKSINICLKHKLVYYFSKFRQSILKVNVE